MARKILPLISLIGISIFGILFLGGAGDDDNEILRETFLVDATYYDSGYVEISFKDVSERSSNVVMEILGMETTFQKQFQDNEFLEIVPFEKIPKYGWAIHPIVLEIQHEEFGHIQLKTEIHNQNEPKPIIIFARL